MGTAEHGVDDSVSAVHYFDGSIQGCGEQPTHVYF